MILRKDGVEMDYIPGFRICIFEIHEHENGTAITTPFHECLHADINIILHIRPNHILCTLDHARPFM